MKRSRVLTWLTVLACGLSMAGCASAQQKKQTAVGFYLDTVITLTAYVDDAAVLNDALEECGRYERLLSRTVEGSDVWRVNHAHGKPTEVSDDAIAILETARQVSDLSGGSFDVTIAPVSTLWDFTSGAAVVPDPDAIAGAAARVDYRKVAIDGNFVTLPEGMMIDLGGIAKGYIADAVKGYLVGRGVKSAPTAVPGRWAYRTSTGPPANTCWWRRTSAAAPSPAASMSGASSRAACTITTYWIPRPAGPCRTNWRR